MAVGPVYRLFAYIYFPEFNLGAQDFKAATLTPGSLDILGAGALLALLWDSGIPRNILQKYLTRLVLPVGLVLLFICLILYHYWIKPSVLFVLADTAMALIFTWVVSAAATGFRGVVGKFLEFPVFYAADYWRICHIMAPDRAANQQLEKVF